MINESQNSKLITILKEKSDNEVIISDSERNQFYPIDLIVKNKENSIKEIKKNDNYESIINEIYDNYNKDGLINNKANYPYLKCK